MTASASTWLKLAARSSLYIVLGLGLVHCSPKNPETDKAEESASEQAAEDGDVSRDQLMLQDGWRRGKLLVEVDIQQKGKSDGSNSALTNSWETSIQGKSEQAVWVAKDLRLFVSEEPDSETRKGALDYEPFSWMDEAADATVSGSLSHAATSILGDGSSGKITRSAVETGTVSRIYLSSLHPSLYGKGYEASIDLNVDAKRQVSSTMESKDLPQPVVENENKELVEELSYTLYPTPNSDKLNDYLYIPDLAGDELKAQIQKHHQDILSVLQQLAADTFPVQTELRAGARTEATKDQLTLTYEYSGEKQLPVIISVDSLSGKASPNLLKIKITLKAD